MSFYQKLGEAVTTPGIYPEVSTEEFPGDVLHYALHLTGASAVECTCALQEQVFDGGWVTTHDVRMTGQLEESAAFDTRLGTGRVRLVVTSITGELNTQVTGGAR